MIKAFDLSHDPAWKIYVSCLSLSPSHLYNHEFLGRLIVLLQCAHLRLKNLQTLGPDLTCRLVPGPTNAKKRQDGTEKAGGGEGGPERHNNLPSYRLDNCHKLIHALRQS